MSATLEHIKTEIRGLTGEELELLLRDLQSEYVMPNAEDDDEASVEEAWETEITRRLQEVQEGKVKMISGAESDRMTAAVFAKPGIQRRSA